MLVCIQQVCLVSVVNTQGWHRDENHLLSLEETAAWFSWIGQKLCWHACLSSSRVRPHTAPDAQHRCLGEVWQQEAFRRSRLATHTPSDIVYVLGEFQLSSSFKKSDGHRARVVLRVRLCIPPSLFLSFLLMSSHLPSFSSLFSFPKHMLNSWLRRINNCGVLG